MTHDPGDFFDSFGFLNAFYFACFQVEFLNKIHYRLEWGLLNDYMAVSDVLALMGLCVVTFCGLVQ
jgi:hypothetical protein